jgi:hypothetical protein
MTKTANDGAIRRDKIYVQDMGDGLRLEGEVSPCVFMYPGYPLQVTVTLRPDTGESLGVAYAVDRTLTVEIATDEDVSRLLSARLMRILFRRILECRACQVRES